MDFKQKLSEIVKEYRHQMQPLIDGVEAINVDTRFTIEGKNEAIRKIKVFQEKLDEKANQNLIAEVSKFIEAHRLVEPTKDADYELKVSNALKMIEMLGNNLTDEVAVKLLDFNMNIQQLDIFRTVLENSCPGVYFIKAFEKLDAASDLASAFDNMQASAAGIFDHTRPYSPSDIRVGDIEYYANVINPPAEDPANE